MIDLRSLRPWARPEITGIGRLPMRPRLVPYTSVHEAMATDTLDRGCDGRPQRRVGFPAFPISRVRGGVGGGVSRRGGAR